MKISGSVISLSYALLSLQCRHAVASAKRSSQDTAAPTCPARTVNYLTHSLVQQCRTSSWTSTQESTTSISNATETQIQEAVVVATSNTSSPQKAPQASATQDSTSAALTDPSKASRINNGSSTEATSSSESASQPDSAQTETDTDSPLESGKFLSFEEWKKQNLAKHGQSGDHIGRGRQSSEPRKRPPNMNTALDTFGDDAEIELNFPGFTPEAPSAHDPAKSGQAVDEAPPASSDASDSAPKAISRSPDAGKTCKERFNYASFDCAANVLKTNPEASGYSSVLVENKDSYMLNQCSAVNKFIILELCDDIAIDTIVLANYEFFSSIFRSFRVSVSDRYPVKLEKWKTIGAYEARNTREVQAFLVDNPVIWARYLRIEFLTHYGNEYYCPVSLIRVHGTTMLEDYKHHEDAATSEEEGEGESSLNIDGQAVSEGEATIVESISDAIRPDSLTEKDGDTSHSPETQPSIGSALNDSTQSASSAPSPLKTSPINAYRTAQDLAAQVTNLLHPSTDLCPVPSTSFSDKTASPSGTSTVPINQQFRNDTKAAEIEEDKRNSKPGSQYGSLQQSTNGRSATLNGTKSTGTGLANSKTSAVTGDPPKTAGSTTQSLPPSPTIQESFFKSVQKRLQMLESNSSLSLQYIEDQSRILRDAFAKVEQRQLSKTNGFIDYLNSTVLNELRDFRQQYDQIWQSTVIELEGQREQYQRDMTAMNTRLGILAEEVVFQKRLSILQNILVLLCLGLVLFFRGGASSYLELPIVQNVMARSHSFRFGSGTDDSPIESPYTTRPNSAHRPPKSSLKNLETHLRTAPDDSRPVASSPVVECAPAAPLLDADRADNELSDEMVDKRASSPALSMSAPERPGTSPPAFASGDEDSVVSFG